MDAFLSNISCRKIKVTICATHNLVRRTLQLTLDQQHKISVIDLVANRDDLIEKITRRPPDVILLCLTENEGGNIEYLSKVREVVPQVKTVVISNPNDSLDQTAALKLGVAGIVGANQSTRTLIRAIEQVADGEVWLNQKLITQLLEGSLNSVRGGKGFFRDELTNRELEVVRMIGNGFCNKEISKKLFISEATVRHHLSSIYSKLGIEDRLNLAIYAYRQQIVLPSTKVEKTVKGGTPVELV